MNPGRTFNIYYQNTRGLRSKTEEFLVNSSSSDFDLIAITESWLNNGVYDAELFTSEYTVFRRDRDVTSSGKSDGGGVLCAVKATFEVERCPELETTLEDLWLKVKVHNKYIFVCVAYFPPYYKLEHYKIFFRKLNLNYKIFDKDCIILADFNLKPQTECFNELQNFILYHNLRQHNNQFNVNNRLLDLVLSNLSNVTVSNMSEPFVPLDLHHPCLHVTLVFEHFVRRRIETEDIQNDFLNFNFKRANFLELYYLFENQDWSYLYLIPDVDLALEYFYETVFSIMRQCIPFKRKMKKSYPPWFSHEIIKAIRKKERLHQKYKDSGLRSDYDQFSEIRAKIKRDLKEAYRVYSENSCNNSQEFWKFVKSKKKNQGNCCVMEHNGAKLESKKEICEAFKDHFKSVYLPNHPSFNINEILNEPVSENMEMLNIDCVTEEEVMIAIKKLKPKKSRGFDGLPAFIFKGCSNSFKKPLSYIFNLILKTSTFPSKWKVAKVLPIPKSGMNKRKISGYRPISILSVPNKLFELILTHKILNHVKAGLSQCQHGFLPGKSTSTNLLHLMEFISEDFQNGYQTDVIYTDFAKAFDKVNHDVLLKKLRRFGFSEKLISLFISYFRDRKQYVVYENVESEQYNVFSSVCQGSTLGPLLFVLFINDLPDCISHSKILMFADDVKIFKTIHNLEDCHNLQADLNNLVKWSDENQLPLNIDKCQIISYTLKSHEINFNYNINNVNLLRVSEVRDLGVLLDKKLNFKEHIENICKKGFRLLGFVIRNSRNIRNLKTITNLFNAIVRSVLEFNSIIWDPQFKCHIVNLERIQKRFLKYLYFRDRGFYPNEIPYEILLEHFQVSSLKFRRSQASLTELHKIFHSLIESPELLCKLKLNANLGLTRTKEIFYLSVPRVNVCQNSPLYRSCRLYNLNAKILDITSSVTKFKKSLGEIILNV